MFNIFKRKKPHDSPSEKRPLVSLMSYGKFLHRFVDHSERHSLVSLKVGDSDWGNGARFLEPVFHSEGPLAFTWELKAAPFHSSHLLKRIGWNQRSILIDLENEKFEAGPWKELEWEELKREPNWHFSNKAKSINSFSSPDMKRVRSSDILRVTDEFLTWREMEQQFQFSWKGIQKIHFSKRAINILELPFLEAEIKYGGRNYRLELPKDAHHPFYQKLIQLGHLSEQNLLAFLTAEEETDLWVLSLLGNLQLPPDGFDLESAAKGLLSGENFLNWTDIRSDRFSEIPSVSLGGMTLGTLILDEREPFPHLPRKSFYFHFSTVSGVIDRETTIRNSLFEMRLSYDQSEGFGSLHLDDEFYRKTLLSSDEFSTNFSPREFLEVKIHDINLAHVSSFPLSNILPAPDHLHKRFLTFWRGENGQCGLTLNGYLYLWKSDEFISIENEVLDEWRERGGPYYEAVLTLQNSFLRLSTLNQMDLTKIKAFLLA